MFQSLRNSQARTPIKESVGNWLQYINSLSLNTQDAYKRTILNFTIQLSNKSINKITSVNIQQYLTKFLWNHKKSSANSHLTAIKSYCRFLAETYGIPNVSQSIHNLKADMPYQPFINREQYDKILASATQKESDIIKMLANTGMRCSELCGLRPENISPNLSSIRIQGKGGKIRTIPCNQTVREILSRNIKFPKNRKSIYNICTKAGRKVGQNLPPHVLRRFFATSMVSKGVSLLIVSKLLGHSSIQTTEIYLKLDSSFLQGSTDCLD